MKRTNPQISQ